MNTFISLSFPATVDCTLEIFHLIFSLEPYIRRVGGRSLNDEEMTAYYANLARIHGGLLTGRYKNAICLILDPETYLSEYR